MSDNKVQICGDAAPSLERTRGRRVVSPRCDIRETDATLVLVADMPGVAEGDVDVTLEDGALRIEGRTSIEAPADLTLQYSEYEAVDYARSFAVNEPIDADGISATVQHGTLTVTLPKRKPESRTIEVKAG